MPKSRRTLIALALVSSLGAVPLLAAPSPARACGMRVAFPPNVSPERARPLLTSAAERLDAGLLASARRTAELVARSPRVPAALRAEAWTLAAWIAWRQGAPADARKALKMARALDPKDEVVEPAIARRGLPGETAKFRAETERAG